VGGSSRVAGGGEVLDDLADDDLRERQVVEVRFSRAITSS
jgi:hypothetical protein